MTVKRDSNSICVWWSCRIRNFLLRQFVVNDSGSIKHICLAFRLNYYRESPSLDYVYSLQTKISVLWTLGSHDREKITLFFIIDFNYRASRQILWSIAIASLSSLW